MREKLLIKVSAIQILINAENILITLYRLRSGYAQKSEKIIICAFGFEKNGRKSSFFRSGFHQIIIKSPQIKNCDDF